LALAAYEKFEDETMNKIIVFAFTLAFAGIGIYAQNMGTIKGKVVFGGDKSPLHDVSIKINELNKTAFTDDSGNFTFANIPPGKYTLVAHQEGFGNSTNTVTVVAGTPAVSDFELVISSISEQVTVTGSGSEETASRRSRP
jgi:uncharacterized protein (DUF2141 family)